MKFPIRFIALLLAPSLAVGPSGASDGIQRASHFRPSYHSQAFGSQALSPIADWVQPPSSASRIYRLVKTWFPAPSGMTTVLRPGIAALAVVASWGLAQAQQMPSLNGWVPYFRPDAAKLALQNYGNRFSELSIFALRSDSAGALTPAKDFVHEAVIAARALKPRPRVLLTATNDTAKRPKDSRILSRWIGRPKDRAKHIADLLTWMEKEEVDGLDVDYENVKRTDGAHFTSFIAELAAALHSRGKYLTVTVEPKMQDGARPIDWRAVAQSADRVRVMAYQYHGPKTKPGLISPPEDVAKLADYARSQIPLDKLEIALAMYGFDWPRRGKAALVGTRDQFDLLAHLAEAETWLDPVTRAGRITYKARKGKKWVEHDVWVETAASLVNKIEMLHAKGITRIGVWQLGAGDMSELFTLLSPKASISSPTPPVGARLNARPPSRRDQRRVGSAG